MPSDKSYSAMRCPECGGWMAKHLADGIGSVWHNHDGRHIDFEPVELYAVEQLHEIAYEAAGAASGVFLEELPDMVMPSTEVAEAVGRVLDDHDIPTLKGYPRR